jgi:hypothetical protein
MWGAHWSILLEKAGVPGVYIVDEPFKADVEITCDKEGMPGLRRVLVPHPCGDVPDTQLPDIISLLVQSLTSPLTDTEHNPKRKETQKPSRVVFRGSVEEVNRFFYARGWSDGLPIIPPTEEAVGEMLKGTRHPADKIVTTNMLPESYTVTVENVATVGVMAGCEPKYMPVLLSMVEAFSDECFSSSVRSTSSFSFAVIVSGPIAKEIGMNGGINALGSGTGNKPNATIGRFLRLAIICLGGSRTGVSDLSSIGNPTKYSFAFTENTDKSPWEPFHVSAGFKPEDSVVTLMSGGYSHHSPFGHADIGRIAKSIATYELPTGVLIIMDPTSAKKVSSQGYAKEAAEEFIWSHATRTVAEFKDDFFYESLIEPVLKGKPWYRQRGLWPAEYLELPPDRQVPVFPRGHVRILVVGGETNPFTAAWQFARPVSVVVDQWR